MDLLLKTKSETCNAVIQFITQAEKYKNHRVKIVQTDDGTEYKPLNDYFQRNGILHRPTCPNI